MPGFIGIIISLLILGLAFWLIVWLIDWIGVPEPFNKLIKAIVGIIFVLWLLGLLFGFAPVPNHNWWVR